MNVNSSATWGNRRGDRSRIRAKPGQRKRLRSAAVAVEMALVLPVLLTVLLGLLEMSLSILRQNSLSECARRGARAAAVRGKNSTAPLGPVAWSGTAAENHAVSAAIRDLLTTMPPEHVQVAVTWPDASNRAGRPVQVRLSYTHDSVFASWFGSGSLSLSSTSTLQIAN